MDNQINFIPAGGSFPVNAKDLRLAKYQAADTLGEAELEEAAVRLLLFSQQEGQYVGVPWNDVMLQYLKEEKESIEEDEEYSKRLNEFQEECMEYYQNRTAYMERGFKTLGISLLFTKMPTKPTFNAPVRRSKFHSIHIMLEKNPQEIIDAFWSLINEGLVKKETHNEVDYFIPTPELVAKLVRA